MKRLLFAFSIAALSFSATSQDVPDTIPASCSEAVLYMTSNLVNLLGSPESEADHIVEVTPIGISNNHLINANWRDGSPGHMLFCPIQVTLTGERSFAGVFRAWGPDNGNAEVSFDPY